MSYIVTKTDGTTLATIVDGTKDTTSSSLTLLGRNYSNYGQFIANDFVWLLENFSNTTPPNNPIIGQIWWSRDDKLLKVYSDTNHWKTISSATTADVAPVTQTTGDIWWDTINNQLYIYSGSQATPYDSAYWVLVGPQRNNSGAVWESITDNLGASHDVLSVYLDGVRTAVISTDPAFTPNVAIPNIPVIQLGYNMRSLDTLWGTANNANYLGNQPPSKYFRKDLDNITTGNIVMYNDSGIIIGATNQLHINTIGNNAVIMNSHSGGNVELSANVAGTMTKVLTVNGVTGITEVATDPTTAMGVVTKRYADGIAFIKANIASPVFTGNPQAPTPGLFDQDTSIATTAFVQNSLGNYSESIVIQANVTLANTHVGSAVTFANVASIATLPLISTVQDGSSFLFQSIVLSDCKVQTQGVDTIAIGTITTSNITIGKADSVSVVAANVNGGTRRWVASGVATIPFGNLFQSSSFTTQPQFTNNKTLATTEFVQRAIGNYRSWTATNNTTTLSAAHIGYTIETTTNAGYTITLPPTSGLYPGASIRFTCTSGGYQYIAPNTGDQIFNSGSSLTIHVGETYDFIFASAGQWRYSGMTRPYDISFYGNVNAPTMPVGTANTSVATTAFVINNSGFFANKIYHQNSNFTITDTGVGAAALTIDGTTVMTATASGVALPAGATAYTWPQTVSNTTIATTSFVNTATLRWAGSAKFMSNTAPDNNLGINGDIWFQYQI